MLARVGALLSECPFLRGVHVKGRALLSPAPLRPRGAALANGVDDVQQNAPATEARLATESARG
jgi:hypothetical protein